MLIGIKNFMEKNNELLARFEENQQLWFFVGSARFCASCLEELLLSFNQRVVVLDNFAIVGR